MTGPCAQYSSFIRILTYTPLLLALSGCAGHGGVSISKFSASSLFGAAPSVDTQPLADIAISECDRLAAIDGDLGLPPGLSPVDNDDLQTPAAIAACERDLGVHPDHPRLLTQLGRSYGAAYRYADALAAYRSAAQAGYPYAVYMIGRYYQNGYGVPRDYDAAESWYLKAGQLGQRDAWNRIGLLYSELRKPTDRGKAIDAYRRAAEAGLPVAMVNLAFYLRARDGWRDKSAALQWTRKAAESGFAMGMVMTGDHYHLEDDYETAARWYWRAADLNDGMGLHKIADYFYYGNVGPPAKGTALEYYERSAKAGYMPAAIKAAMMYAKGDGVPRNDELAMAWLLFGAPKKPADI